MNDIPHFLNWLKASFDTNTVGASGRKLSAFVMMCCIVAIHIAWLRKAFVENDFSLMESLLITDYAFVSALFGMTTYSTIKENNRNIPPVTENKEPKE